MQLLTPEPIATQAFTDAASAVARLTDIYERNTGFLRDRFEAYANGAPLARVRAAYPFVRITTATHARLDSRLAYGFVARPGVHETSVTRPDVFRSYLTEQISLLLENHRVPVEIGESREPIPVHFAYRRDINIAAAPAGGAIAAIDRPLRDVFDTPDLAAMDDAIPPPERAPERGRSTREACRVGSSAQAPRLASASRGTGRARSPGLRAAQARYRC